MRCERSERHWQPQVDLVWSDPIRSSKMRLQGCRGQEGRRDAWSEGGVEERQSPHVGWLALGVGRKHVQAACTNLANCHDAIAKLHHGSPGLVHG